MPWTVKDVNEHMKDLSPSEKETWVEVANKALAACEKAGRKDCDASAIKQANAVVGKIREAWMGEEGDFSEAVTKTEDGVEFPASDYAYVPDPEHSTSWKLRLTSTPGSTPDAGIVGAAIAALGKGFRGKKVQIPAGDLPAVKAKVRAAWKKANPDKEAADMPTVIREALTPDEGAFVEAASFKAIVQRFMKAAGVLAGHAFISKGTRKRLSGLQDALRAEHGEVVGEAPASASEAAGGASGNTEEFREDGVLLEVDDG